MNWKLTHLETPRNLRGQARNGMRGRRTSHRVHDGMGHRTQLQRVDNDDGDDDDDVDGVYSYNA